MPRPQMDENKDHFLCGICKAGFQQSSFLHYLEHMVRHLNVSRNNKCIICQKGFARAQSLKEHLLHFHAIPLKTNLDFGLEAENTGKTSEPGSARCNFRNRKEVTADSSSASVQTHSQYLFCVNGTTNLPAQSEIITIDGPETHEAAIDVLSIRDVEQNVAGNIELFSQQTRNFNSIEEGISYGTSPPKSINPNIFLVDPSPGETNLDNLAKNMPSEKVKCLGEDPEMDARSGRSIIKSASLGHCAPVISNFDDNCNRQLPDEMKVLSSSCRDNNKPQDIKDLCSSGGQVHLKSLEVSDLSSKKEEDCLSVKISPLPRVEQNALLTESLGFNGMENVLKPDSNQVMKLSMHSTKQNSTGALNTRVNKFLNKTLKEARSNSKLNEDSIDFHFFLGTVAINGSSMTYNRVEFRCFHCPFVCAWRPSLIKHMKNIHRETLNFHKFLDIRNVESNSLCEEKLRKYKVTKLSEYLLAIGKPRRRKKGLRTIERQDIPGKYSCPVCSKVFRRIRYLRRHQLSHRVERNHTCDTCGKSFKTRATCLAHQRSHKSRSYHCPQCDFVSNLTSAIHRHRQIHPNGSVICDICGSAYIDKSTLKKHTRVHDISRPYPCTFPGCTWRFKSENMRKAHVQSHTTQGKFRCLHCGYCFRHKHHLQRHLMRVHSQASLLAKIQSGSALDLDSTMAGSSIFYQHRHHNHEEDLLKDPTNLTIYSSRPVPDSQEILLSSSAISESESIHPLPHSSIDIKLPQVPADIFLEEADKSLESSVNHNKPAETMVIGMENGFGDDLPTNSIGNLEYVTENGEIIQVVKPHQVYMRHDRCGNLVEYRITTDTRQGDINNCQPVYLIGTESTVLESSGSQDQSLLLS